MEIKIENKKNKKREIKIYIYIFFLYYFFHKKKLTKDRTFDGSFFDKDFKVLVDGSGGKKDTGTRADGTNKVGADGESSNTKTTKSGSRRDVPFEDLDNRFISVTRNLHALVFELTSDIFGGRARNIDPSFGEEGARGKNESYINDTVERISGERAKARRRREVVT